MQLNLLKCKLHQARVTHAELDYDGSCAIDSRLLELAGIVEFEQIQIYNITNGERFTTYAILAEPGSGIGDRVIICAYANFEAAEAKIHKPRLVYLDAENRVVRSANTIAVQAA
jgi:aspartate 1-decarboxylase